MATAILTADTSLVVPSLVGWHALHARAASAVREVRQLSAHVFVESYAVLTRLPSPGPLKPAMAALALEKAFPDEPLGLRTDRLWGVLRRLGAADMPGARAYDALVGATAAEAGARLLTADRRALPIYGLLGVDFELVD